MLQHTQRDIFIFFLLKKIFSIVNHFYSALTYYHITIHKILT